MKYLSVLVCAGVMAMANGALAEDFRLEDDAGGADITLPGVSGGSGSTGATSGMTSLERNVGGVAVDHIDDMSQHWWWLGTNGGAARPIHDFAAGATTGTLEFLGDGNTQTPMSPANTVEFSYTGAGTQVTGRYQLDGGALGDWSTNLSKSLTVENMSGQYQTYRLYSMSNLSLTQILAPGTGWSEPTDEMALQQPGGQIRQEDFSLHGGGNFSMSTAVTTPASEALRADIAGGTGGGPGGGADGLVSQPDLDLVLQNWAQTVGVGHPADMTGDGFVGQGDLDIILQNWAATGPLTPTAVQVTGNGSGAIVGGIEGGSDLNGNTVANPAGQQTGEDVSFAFQWTFTLAPGGSFTVTENTDIVPEPASLALLGVGALLISRRHRRA